MNPPSGLLANAGIAQQNKKNSVVGGELVGDQLDDDDIDLLILTAQEHDIMDECKRVFASQRKLVS